MARTKICIDAGHNHSGFNTGAVGNDMREQDITFDVSERLKYLLQKDFDILLTRPSMTTNLGTDNASAVNARWRMANQWGANYFLSIHTNAGNGTGAETFINNDRSQRWATILNMYCQKMELRNRGIKRNNLAVITHATMPSTLLELAFIDAPLTQPDVNILRNKRQEMAEALADSIYNFFGMQREVEKSPTPPTPPIEEEKEVRYTNLNEVPTWGKPTIQKLLTLGFLQGDGNNLNLTEDMVRLLVINDRAGIYK